jgi:phosphatidylglycerol---prolipoprotein diacylglyceryl transferase
MFPKLFSIGGFFLPTYGVLVAAGFLAGIWVTTRLAKRSGLNPEIVTNLAIYCALTGLAGAKLMMFLLNIDYYRANPRTMFSFDTLLSAGVFHGGFLAALVFAWFYVQRHQLPWLRTLDVLAPGAALGHAIGRLGCFAAGCCWGDRCDRPWAVTFTSPDAHEITGVPLGVALHPTQIYEALLTFTVAYALYRSFSTKRTPGWTFGLYLALYGPVRIVTEYFREHDQVPPFGGPLTWTQWIAGALTLVGIWLLMRSRAGAATAAHK